MPRRRVFIAVSQAHCPQRLLLSCVGCQGGMRQMDEGQEATQRSKWWGSGRAAGAVDAATGE